MGPKQGSNSSIKPLYLERFRVLNEVQSGHLTQLEAANVLGVSDRQIRRMLQRLDAEGLEGLINKNTGQAGHHRKPEEEKDKILKFHRDLYPDAGPTFFADLLKENHQLSVSHETLRLWLDEDGQRESTPAKPRHRRRRDRKPCLGSMVQLDTSVHDWFRTGENSYLILFIDDATNTIDGRFYETDSTRTNMAAMKGYIERHGCPDAFYVDKASHFRVNRGEKSEDIVDPSNKELTQIERALGECGIRLIHANSPQAKGRIERKFATLQDRLEKRLHYDNIKDIDSANEYLKSYYLQLHNAKFACEPMSSINLHKPPIGLDLDAIFSIHVQRVVTNDFTFSLDRVKFQIERNNDLHWLRRKKVLIEKRLDGSLEVRHLGKYLRFSMLDT
ncbi:MAG: ISNCY family transposase [Deltaproteobacteria bacterium]|jgi:transposase-like protein|nr:ISNCY family transposase [Deltaproteobacteria bacterium]